MDSPSTKNQRGKGKKPIKKKIVVEERAPRHRKGGGNKGAKHVAKKEVKREIKKEKRRERRKETKESSGGGFWDSVGDFASGVGSVITKILPFFAVQPNQRTAAMAEYNSLKARGVMSPIRSTNHPALTASLERVLKAHGLGDGQTGIATETMDPVMALPVESMQSVVADGQPRLMYAGSDYMQTVSVPPNGYGQGDVIYNVALNPRKFINTRLAAMGKLYEEYRIKRFMVLYEAAVPTTTTGALIAYFDYDVEDKTTPDGLANLRIASSNWLKKMNNVWENQSYEYQDPDPYATPLYTDPNSQDERWSSQGRFTLLAANAMAGAGGTTWTPLGNLYMGYEIEYLVPQLDFTNEGFIPTWWETDGSAQGGLLLNNVNLPFAKKGATTNLSDSGHFSLVKQDSPPVDYTAIAVNLPIGARFWAAWSYLCDVGESNATALTWTLANITPINPVISPSIVDNAHAQAYNYGKLSNEAQWVTAAGTFEVTGIGATFKALRTSVTTPTTSWSCKLFMMPLVFTPPSLSTRKRMNDMEKQIEILMKEMKELAGKKWADIEDEELRLNDATSLGVPQTGATATTALDRFQELQRAGFTKLRK